MLRALLLRFFVQLLFFTLPALSLSATPVRSGFVVANGVRLHYLDWGGDGPALLLLSGLRDTAHVFDEVAPAFTYRFHVYALTRRGFGESARPKSGYDTSTRVEDIRAFLDALKVARVNLMGHSLAGDELTLFAGRYPERVARLVYLDTLYDHSPRFWNEMRSDPVPHSPLMERAKLEAIGRPGGNQLTAPKMLPPDDWAVLVATIRGMMFFEPDYKKVRAPALAICAVTANARYPRAWLPDHASAELRVRADAWWQKKGHAFVRAALERFQRELPQAKVIELNDAPHYLFRGATRDKVIASTRAFLLR